MSLIVVGRALIAACGCWLGVTLYFFRRYTLAAWLALPPSGVCGRSK